MVTILPDIPTSSAALISGAGVLVVALFFIKKSSNDRQYLIAANIEAKTIEAAMQKNIIDALAKN